MPFSLTDVYPFELDNGLSLLVREDHSVPVVTSMIWYRVGSRVERPGETGVSHFIEHMMFKGTGRFKKGEIDSITAAGGGFNNAFTSHDYTAYYFGFASDRWKIALEIEADRMSRLVIDSEELELERQVILEEIRLSKDNPWEALRRAADAHVLKGHPYAGPVIGDESDVARLSAETLMWYYDRHYHPGSALLVVAGDCRAESVYRRVREVFGSLDEGPVVRDRGPLLEIEPSCRGDWLRMPQPSHVSRMLISLPFPEIKSSHLPAMQVVDRMLSQGKLSRLYDRLVEREGLVSMVTTDFEETRDPYRLFIRVDVCSNAQEAETRKVILEELDLLCSEEAPVDEVEKAKKQCVAQFYNDLETTFDQAFQLGLFATLADWKMLEHYVRRIESVTPAAVRQAAERYCSPELAHVCSLSAGEPEE